LTVVNNNPRFDVWTNKDGDKNNGSIQGKMDAVGFSTFLNRFLNILKNGAPKSQISLVCSRPGQNRGEVIREATVVAGLDDNGIAYISVVAADSDRPKIKFMFGNTQFQTLAGGQGTKLTDSEISIGWAFGWLEAVERVIGNIFTDKYVHKEPGEKKPGGGYGGGGGYQKKSYQGGGGNSSNQQDTQRQPAPAGNDFEDDLPF
jgi:hypothetical protein